MKTNQDALNALDELVINSSDQLCDDEIGRAFERLLAAHGETIKQALTANTWQPIDKIHENTSPTVVLYHPKFADNCLPVTCSNSEFAKINAAKQGYTLWRSLSLPEQPPC